jgi:hypothetical protein
MGNRTAIVLHLTARIPAFVASLLVEITDI